MLHQNKRFWVLIICTILCCRHGKVCSQGFDLEEHRNKAIIPFKLIRELIIINLRINNQGPFNFILDSGVGTMLITEPKLIDSIDIASKRTVRIAGLGNGIDFEAFITSPLKVEINGLKSNNVSATILKTDHFGLGNYAGLPIHGLIGYEFFKSLAIKIDFEDSTIVASMPKNAHQFKRGIKIPITIEERKPYIKSIITLPNGLQTVEKLIFDLGAGHSISLENRIQSLNISKGFIVANLGMGLTGPINGYLGRVNEVKLGKYSLKNVIASFPEKNENTTSRIKRDGNIGLGILKRFNMLIDYPDSCIYLKKNANFVKPFEHDMSGLEYYSTGNDLKRVIVNRVEPGSAGYNCGIEKDDEIYAINFKPVRDMQLADIDVLFSSQDDRSFLVEIYRKKILYKVILTLKKRL